MLSTLGEKVVGGVEVSGSEFKKSKRDVGAITPEGSLISISGDAFSGNGNSTAEDEDTTKYGIEMPIKSQVSSGRSRGGGRGSGSGRGRGGRGRGRSDGPPGRENYQEKAFRELNDWILKVENKLVQPKKLDELITDVSLRLENRNTNEILDPEHLRYFQRMLLEKKKEIEELEEDDGVGLGVGGDDRSPNKRKSPNEEHKKKKVAINSPLIIGGQKVTLSNFKNRHANKDSLNLCPLHSVILLLLITFRDDLLLSHKSPSSIITAGEALRNIARRIVSKTSVPVQDVIKFANFFYPYPPDDEVHKRMKEFKDHPGDVIFFIDDWEFRTSQEDVKQKRGLSDDTVPTSRRNVKSVGLAEQHCILLLILSVLGKDKLDGITTDKSIRTTRSITCSCLSGRDHLPPITDQFLSVSVSEVEQVETLKSIINKFHGHCHVNEICLDCGDSLMQKNMIYLADTLIIVVNRTFLNKDGESYVSRAEIDFPLRMTPDDLPPNMILNKPMSKYHITLTTVTSLKLSNNSYSFIYPL